ICPPTATLGMRRCLYHALDIDTNPLTSFMGVCIAAPNPQLQPNMASLAFTNVPIGMLSAPKTVKITNIGSGSSGTLQLQIDNDLQNDYVLGAPCSSNVNGCDVGAVALLMNGSIDVTVYCRPTTTTPPPANLWLTLGAATLQAPITLTCSTMTGSGAV